MPDSPRERAPSKNVCHSLLCLVTEHTSRPCSNWRRVSLSLVQHLSWHPSQMKNLTLGGAQDFQFNFQDLDTTDPWKRA
jgi:hypothetical protein